MTGKHRTPEYRRNARTIRARVDRIHRLGDDVPCWRCGGPITPGMAYDVGHLPGAEGNAPHELAPEHRLKSGACRGNRSHGGSLGAALTNQRRTPPAGQITAWNL